MLARALRHGAVSLAFAALCLCPRSSAEQASSQASSSPLELTWNSSEPSCSGEPVVAGALREAKAEARSVQLQVQARVSREGEAWVAELDTRSGDRTGRRVLRGGSCEEIQRAVALLLALILESGDEPHESLPAPQPIRDPPSSPAPPPRTPAPPLIVPAPAPPAGGLDWLLRAEGQAGLWLQPGVAMSFGGSAGMGWDGIELGLTFQHSLATTERLRGSLIKVWRQSLGLELCVNLLQASHFELLPCIAPQLALIHVDTQGLDEPFRTDATLLHGLSGSFQFRFWVSRPTLFLTVIPALGWEPSQPFQVGYCEDCARTTVFESIGLGPRLGAALGVRF